MPYADLQSAEVKRSRREAVRRWREKNPGYAKRYYAENRDKHNAAVKKWVDKNPGHALDARLRREYGMTTHGMFRLLGEQGGVCAICEEVPNPPCVDHCHTTGTVRGILCRVCNTGIGHLRDDPDLLRQAIEYLQRHITPQ